MLPRLARPKVEAALAELALLAAAHGRVAADARAEAGGQGVRVVEDDAGLGLVRPIEELVRGLGLGHSVKQAAGNLVLETEPAEVVLLSESDRGPDRLAEQFREQRNVLGDELGLQQPG